ncbi:MAG: [Fe-Fe] hydrogenase large subunit C-terminal domain-containing protein, partial [Clostridiales bacterium]
MDNVDLSSDVIKVNKDKCINCHRCISVCPVKYCNNASDIEEGIKINPDLCIACGECIKACSHNAREIMDDTEKFFKDLSSGVKITTLIAPAVDTNFPSELGNLLSWFKHMGVKRNLDVSIGAEITTYKYIELLKNKVKRPVISQSCPCVVNFIEIYKPDLIKYLAPINSPAINTAKWVH